MFKLPTKIVIDANIILGFKLGFGLGVIISSALGFVAILSLLLFR